MLEMEVALHVVEVMDEYGTCVGSVGGLRTLLVVEMMLCMLEAVEVITSVV